MKLWIVRIERSAYVMAETEAEALEQQSEIERWEDFPEVSAELADGTTMHKWDDKCLVYHAGVEDVTLKVARERCADRRTPEQPDREAGES